MKKYPSNLPVVLREGFTAGINLKREPLTMDDGQSFNRRVWGKTPFGYNLTWLLTSKELRLLEAWLEYDIFRTGESFTIDIGGTVQTVRPKTGELKVTYQGGNWFTSLSVEKVVDAPVFGDINQLPVWPSTLPTLEGDDYSYSTNSGNVASDIEAGTSQLRKRFRDNNTEFSGSILVDTQGLADFWNFYTNTAINGTAWFDFPFEDGKGRSVIRAKFGNTRPAVTPFSSWYQVTLSLETNRKPIYNITEYNELRPIINDYVEAGYVEEGYVGYFD